MNEDALDKLQELLRTHAELIASQNKANELKERELEIQQFDANNKARELDLQAQQLATERERLNRAEARLQEILLRYVGLAEQNTVLADYLKSHFLGDDALRDWFEYLSQRLANLERDMMLVLMEKLDSRHVRTQAEAAIDELGQSLNVESTRRQLSNYYKTRNKLKERIAAGEDDVKLFNQLEQAEEEIVKLEEELKEHAPL